MIPIPMIQKEKSNLIQFTVKLMTIMKVDIIQNLYYFLLVMMRSMNIILAMRVLS